MPAAYPKTLTPPIQFLVQHHDVPPPDGSAVETWIYEIARRLSAQGENVRVYCPKEDPGLLREQRDGIRFFKFKAGPVRRRFLVKMLGLRRMDTFQTLARSALKENEGWLILENVAPSNLHGLTHRPDLLSRVIYHAHNELYWDFDKIKIPRLICCSRFIEECYRKQGYKGEICVVPNGVSAEEGRASLSDQTKFRLRGFDGLFVGRITREKGLHKLLDALRVLKKSGHDFQVACASPIPTAENRPKGCKRLAYFNELQRTIENEGLSFQFIGPIPHHEVIASYREVGVALVPSTFNEPFSMSALEGLASGAICLLSNRGGLPNTARHLMPPGAMLDPEDSEGWSSALLQAKLARGIDLGEQAEKVIGEYEWANVADQMQQCLNRWNAGLLAAGRT